MEIEDIVRNFVEKYYRGPLQKTSKGYLILCPFHQDSNPSCNLYDTGVFLCWSCEKKTGPVEGFTKMGVPARLVDKYFGSDRDKDSLLEPPPKLEDIYQQEEKEGGGNGITEISVMSEKEWPKDWVFRDLSEKALVEGPIKEFFDPKLVSLMIRSKGKNPWAESLPRLSLGFPGNKDLRVYLRLSSHQERKVINDPKIGVTQLSKFIPFGLKSRRLGEGCKVLVMVEGPYDLLRMLDHYTRWCGGKYDGRVEFMALLGTTQWEAKLREMFSLYLASQFSTRHLFLAFDNDDAGEKITAMVGKDLLDQRSMLLSKYRLGYIDYFPTHDPGEIVYKQACEIFEGLPL